MELKWYESEATHEVKEVQTDASPTTVFLRRNIHKETKEDEMVGTYEVWAYKEATVTHEEYEQMLTDEIARLTPYTETKQAYIDDTSITFTEVPQGNLSVNVTDGETYPDYTVERSGDTVRIGFEPLQKVTTVTISVL